MIVRYTHEREQNVKEVDHGDLVANFQSKEVIKFGPKNS